MHRIFTSKGQVTIPKKMNKALKLVPGAGVEFAVNRDDDVVLRKVGARKTSKPDRLRGGARMN